MMMSTAECCADASKRNGLLRAAVSIEGAHRSREVEFISTKRSALNTVYAGGYRQEEEHCLRALSLQLQLHYSHYAYYYRQ